MKRFILLLIISVSIHNISLAQGYNIALMGAEQSQAQRDDVFNKMNATGIFSSIDVYDVSSSTPATTTMLNYDAILVWSNTAILDPLTFGDNLAAYIEAGGGVVSNYFTFYSENSNSIGGSFASNYSLINSSATLNTAADIVSYVDSSHPIINEYVGFNGGSFSFHGTGLTLTTGTTVLANWGDGSPFAVYKENIGPASVRRVDLNFWPVSNDAFTGGWISDGDTYLANALAWVAGGFCSSQVLTAATGTISDGSGKNLDYSNDQNCSWLIAPSGATSISLDFTFMDMESCCDAVTVYDGPDNLSPVIGSYTGTAVPGPINSSGGSLFVEFTANATVTQQGFGAEYSTNGFTSIDIIGTGTTIGDWITGINLIQDSGNPNIWQTNMTLSDGEVKFRAGNDWATNWGGQSFPFGLGEHEGDNIPVSAGNYNIQFNSNSGEYRFVETGFAASVLNELNGGSSKQWTLDQNGLGYGIGPQPGDLSWWNFGVGGFSTYNDRPCAGDDIYTFTKLGNLGFNSNNTIWLDGEPTGWNDALGANQCHDENEAGLWTAWDGTDVSAFDDDIGSYFYTYDPLTSTLTVNGDGFYIAYSGLSNTQGENFPVPVKEFIVTSIGGGVMQLSMPVAEGLNGYWTANMTEIGAPAQPANLISYATSSSEIILDWEDVNFEDGYYIRRSTDGSSYSQIDFVNADITSYTDNDFGSGLSPNTLYYYQVSSNSTFGESSPAETENATFSTSLTTNFNYNDVYGGVNYDYSEGIATDSQGNYYITGRYNDQIEFKGNILTSTNSSNQNSLFLTKFDKDGNVFWARSVDPDIGIWPRNVAVADDNSIYVIGNFMDNITFAGSTITSSPGNSSIFVLKYDANGNEIWARTVSSPSFTRAYALDTDDQGNIYVGGRIPADGMTFAGNTVTGGGGILLKYDPNGNEVWMAHAPSVSSGFVTEIKALEINSNGIYVTGDVYGSTDFGNFITVNIADDGDAYVVKYDFNGNAQWVQVMGGTERDKGTGITLDASGNVFVTGYFYSSQFNGPGFSYNNNGAGNTDIFIVKFDQNGNHFWSQTHGNFPNDHPYDITSDGDNLYVTGFKSKRPVSFGGISVDNGSFWLAKYWNDGTVEWVEKMEGYIWGYELDYHNGLVYMAGNFEHTANFGSSQVVADSRDIHAATITVGEVGGLVAHWPMSSGQGLNDISGNGNHLDDEGTGTPDVSDRFKASLGAIQFNGSNYAVARGTNHPQEDPSFSYSFWENHATEGDIRSTVFDVGAGSFEIRIDHFSGNIEVFGNGVQVFSDNTISAASSNRWNHIVVVKDGSDIHIYVNGILTVSSGGFSTNIVSSDIFAGNNSALNTPFTGRMDDMRIFNYAITASEVSTLFNEGVDTSIPLVRLEPSIATADDQVRLIYNAERGNKALMGLEGDVVHIHTGVITTDPNDYQPWNFVIDPTFANNSLGQMTPVGGTANEWEITLGPSIRSFYSVPDDGTPIYKMNMVFRNASDGTLVGNGAPDFGIFSGGYVTDGTETSTVAGLATPGDIYVTVVNPTPLELDQLALEALYQATDGANWTDNTNWLTGPLDTWYGVTVSEGRVTDVFLDSNNLTGTLPSAIGKLDACYGFSLTGNNISGSIPVEIGDMAALESIYLDANQLTGNIPAEIGNLSLLNGLYLNENQLTGIIPTEIGNLTGLTDLSLYTNQLIGSIPTSFQNLTGLNYLDLEENNLNGLIPSFLGSINSLVELWLSNNAFSGSIPPELGNLPNLEELYLGFNELTGMIPVELGNASSLSILDLSGNSLMGEIPPELGNLFNLTGLALSDNLLTGAVPSTFSSLSSLTVLWIDSNQLDEMVDLSSTSIGDLKIDYNKFTMEDILLNNGIPSSYVYDPQELVGEPQTRFIANGSDYQFSLDFDRNVTGSTYEWFWEGVSIITVNGPDIFFMPADNTHTGTWYVTITNEALPGLVLQTEDIYIQVQDICASNATDAADTRIDRVVFGDLDNTSDLTTTQCATYTNFTQYSATVYPGQSVTGGLTMGTCNGEWDKMGVIYIDWSQDGNFDDATERVLWTTDPTNITEFQSGTYTVPSDAAFGTYLMRVIAQETTDLNTITGCGSYEFGETEDYTVNVIDATADLILELVDVTPNSIFGVSGIQSGNDIAITTNIGNAGLVEVVDLVRGVGYYLSEDQVLSGDDIEIGVSGITSLPGGEVITLADEIVTIPGNTSPGAYYLIAEADPDGALNDPDLSDNIDVTPLPITVTAPPDAEDPVVALQNPPSSYILGSGGVTLRASITDNFGIATVLFAYARMSEITDDFDADQYTVTVPEEETSGVYTWTLEDSEFDDIGIQYFFGATDVYGNIGNSTPFPARISVEFSDGSINLGSIQAVSNSNEPQETDYRIFSVPVRSATIGSVLGLSSTDKSEWRVWQYNGGNSELTGTSASLTIGKGYWLIYQNSAGLNPNFGGIAVDASNNNPFILNLSSGFNLIGNPYNFPISWQQVVDHNVNQGILTTASDVSGLTFYQGGFNEVGYTTLNPTEGAFVSSNEPFSLEVPFSSQTTRMGATARRFNYALDNDSWEVGINLSNENTFYNVASVGMHPNAEEGRDKHDLQAMPYLFRYLEFNSSNELLTERISKDFVNTREDHIWEFEAVTTFDPSEAELSWDNSYFGDNDRQLYLYDEQEERIINMREQTSYHFYLHGKQSFRIMYGSPEFIESSLKPDRFTLGHAYPNPFADETRIPFSLPDDQDMYKVRLEVYNSIGELVKVLADDTYGSGFYAADWDGTNVHGQQVSEGIYIYKLSIAHEEGSDDLTGKLMYGRE